MNASKDMMKIECTYKGRRYHKLEDAFMQAAVDGTKELILNKLKPFQFEIAACNGIVNINIPNDLKDMSVELSNMPTDLLERVKTALYN